MKINANLLIYLVLTLCCIYLIGFTFYLNNKLKTNKVSSEIILKKNAENEVKYKTLMEHCKLAFSSDTLLKEMSFENMEVKPGTLFLRIHHNDCNDCVTYSLKLLEELKIKEAYHIVVLADYPSEMALSKDFGKINFPVMLQNHIKIDQKDITKPYFFLYSKNKEVKSVFFPNWQFMDLCEAYLKALN
ncbi:hypothetical protein VRU48_12845 [Pedobacter sp. KR3-3]|uniref:AhpC/TSA family protein n=1 Tax=Pedobacter albus TaxID=3113905 RepID=A0ABU7I9P9_9SPHI|nr:hypothetical protein [Pedobacter sp. KR3-3]MEE1946001.1 hypothetical protein [Pedobacter sp. KR3-3]